MLSPGRLGLRTVRASAWVAARSTRLGPLVPRYAVAELDEGRESNGRTETRHAGGSVRC